MMTGRQLHLPIIWPLQSENFSNRMNIKEKEKKKRKEKENDLLEEGKLRNRILKLPLARSSKRSAGLTVTHVEKPTEEKYSMAVDAGPL